MQNVFLKRFTKLEKNEFQEGAKQKQSRLSNFEFSLCRNLYQSTILHLVKTFRIKTFKKSIKIATEACNHGRIISSDLKPEVDASLNITSGKVMITYCITKSYRFKLFDWLVIKLQYTETETLKPHYIHVYKMFG